MLETLIVASSCQYPADFFRYREAYKSLGAIAELFSKPENRGICTAVMLAGDSIYADATSGLMDATDPHERFTQQYYKLRNNWAWRKIDADERLFSIDDHELIDDWVPLGSGHPDEELRSKREKTRDEGKQAFITEMQLDKWSNGKTYYKHLVNDIPVFVMDSRTERSARNAHNVNDVCMVSKEQRNLLFEWIDNLADEEKNKPESEIAPKIILSGSMLLPRQRTTADRWDEDSSHASCLRSDGWDGYPKTMHQVLLHIVKKGLRKVIFVSGDAHIPCICNSRVKSEVYGAIDIVSVHGSGLNAPFPFANAMAEDYQSEEEFALSAPDNTEPLNIEVETQFPDVGDGFCILGISNLEGRKLCQISFAGKRNNYEPIPFGTV